MTSTQGFTSSVYGPVHSWRVGWSLGVDLLLQTSTCSFNCIYCQLGDIQLKTAQRKIYVPTDDFERDLRRSDWEKADIITFSGSGEPTLALNLAECIRVVKEYTGKPVMILTNGTTLHAPAVQADLMEADVIAVKLDAPNDTLLQRMNRPVEGVSMANIIAGFEDFKPKYHQYKANHGQTGKLALQCMFMPGNLEGVDDMADLIARLHPDEVQLNTPKRPYPLEWNVVSRGNHDAETQLKTTTLRTISEADADWVESTIRAKAGNIPIMSIYKRENPVHS